MAFASKLTSLRITNQNYKTKLFVEQHGLCGMCGRPMLDTEHQELLQLREYSVNTGLDELELHHKVSISEGYKAAKKGNIKRHRKLNTTDNLVLLHKECHTHITYNVSN